MYGGCTQGGYMGGVHREGVQDVSVLLDLQALGFLTFLDFSAFLDFSDVS